MAHRRLVPALSLILLLCSAVPAAVIPSGPPAAPLEGLDYLAGLFPDGDYDPAIPAPGSILGFPLGSRVASPDEIARCLAAWDAASDRVQVSEYARSWEGRSLFTVVLTSPSNHRKADAIRAGYASLGDPAGLGEEEGRRLVDELPAVAWLAYSIHGDETSGADASLAVIYHLIASRDSRVARLLDEVVVVVDPMMNPDGRARWHKQIAEHRGAMPNVDDQSLVHSGYWPWGRMNHYLFDLNRDWILGVNPETRGRIRAASAWSPLLFVDAHEMGSQDTYLFSPQRAPRNPDMPDFEDGWNERFARDQAAAFDRHGWGYYMGEWNEGWYPGYSDSWAAFRGAIGILYEQAGVSEDAVRRPHGALMPYMETVHHQMTSSLANLESLRANAAEIKAAFLESRRQAISEDGPYARRTFAVLPTANTGRLRRFLDVMSLQGIRVYEAGSDVTTARAVDQQGNTIEKAPLPAGTILIPNRQPLANLVATMLAFDTKMTPEYLARERREILRTGRSTIYDITAWNLTMLYGLESLTLPVGLPAGAKLLDTSAAPAAGGIDGPEEAGFWMVDGEDDRSVSLAARLLEAGVEVRVADRAFEFEESWYARGSVVISERDNAAVGIEAAKLREQIAQAAGEAGLRATGALSGYGPGDLPDIGGRHFRLLERPRIALLARGGVSGYDFGSIWHMLDQRIGIRHSHLAEDQLNGTDLRRYNVIVVPDRWFGAPPGSLPGELKSWVEAGGTLIAIGDAAGALAGKDSEVTKARQLQDVLEDLDRYELDLQREWMVAAGSMPPEERIWSHRAAPVVDESWSASPPASRPPAAELKASDAWRRLFMPRGAILAGSADGEHWLTFGSPRIVPILTATAPVLMAESGVDAPVRFGYLADAPKASGPEATRVGWAGLPPGRELRLRMSGLIWPEGAERIANSAYVTRESKGAGQVILFASSPVFRGATAATERLLANALIYGPGLGASHPIAP